MFLLIASIVLLTKYPLSAQSTFGSIRGTVQDAASPLHPNPTLLAHDSSSTLTLNLRKYGVF
jgi:hypothetical protein